MVVQKINSKKKSTYENHHIKNTNHCSGDEGICLLIVKLQVGNLILCLLLKFFVYLIYNVGSNLIIEKVEYENGNFAPNHLTQLYLAQVSNDIDKEKRLEDCKER